MSKKNMQTVTETVKSVRQNTETYFLFLFYIYLFIYLYF